jgi:DNA polymerase III alpha subunit
MACKSGPAFIHLRVHSAYSLLDGATGLAVTDRNNLFGALEIAETLPGGPEGRDKFFAVNPW